MLGMNTTFNYSSLALPGIRAAPGEQVKAQEDYNVYYDCCRAYWHLYTIVDSELRFLDVSINFYKALKQNEVSAEGTPLDPRKDTGWFMGEIEYSYPSLKKLVKEYENHFIREGEYREGQKHVPAYFKMDYSCDKLYGCYKKVSNFPDTNELKAETSAKKAFEAIGCYWNGGSTSIIRPSIEFDDGRSYDGSKNHCEILKWKLYKFDNDKLQFMDISIIFLKERKGGEKDPGTPGDYFKCDGWYVGGIKVSYPSEASVKEQFEKNNKVY